MEKRKSNNMAGRPKGATGKVTASVRESLQSIFDGIAPEIPSILEKLEPTEKLNFAVKLLPWLLPKLEPISEIENNDKTIIINRTIISGAAGEMFGEGADEPEVRKMVWNKKSDLPKPPEHDLSKLTTEELEEFVKLKERQLEIEKKCL